MKHTTKRLGRTLLVLAGVCAWQRSGGAQEIRIRKPACEANPTLCLQQFAGPAPLRERFLRVLRRCDWFAVVADPEQAAYRLRCRYQAGAGDGAALELELQSRSGLAFRFRQTAAPEALPYAAVDSLIRRVFENPGLCNSRLAFAVAGEGRKEVFTSRFDGTGAEQLTHNGTISTEPSWGVGGRALVYTLYADNATSVVLVDVRGQRQRRLSRFSGLNAGAELSPDGRQAALCLSRDGQVDLYLTSLADGTVRRLTQSRAVESSPTWSADGTRICYVSDRAGRPHLYVRSVAGGRAKRILRNPAEAVSPDWSPHSNQICFATRAGDSYAIAVTDLDAESGEMRVVTNAAGDWEAPAWAPDGRHVVCSHRRPDGQRELCMVDTWHGRALPITAPGDYSLPSWSDLQ